MNHPVEPGGAPGGVVKMTDEAVRVVRRRFEDLSAEFDNATEPLKNRYTDMLLGAGQFATELDQGASPFLISWTNVFGVCSDASGLIAGNTNRLSIDLNRLDASSSRTIEL